MLQNVFIFPPEIAVGMDVDWQTSSLKMSSCLFFNKVRSASVTLGNILAPWVRGMSSEDRWAQSSSESLEPIVPDKLARSFSAAALSTVSKLLRAVWNSVVNFSLCCLSCCCKMAKRLSILRKLFSDVYLINFKFLQNFALHSSFFEASPFSLF